VHLTFILFGMKIFEFDSSKVDCHTTDSLYNYFCCILDKWVVISVVQLSCHHTIDITRIENWCIQTQNIMDI